MEELWENYLQYLIWICHLEQFRSHTRLFEMLHNLEFYWSIDRDDNRAGDGTELRDNYDIPLDITCGGEDLVEEFMNKPCSILEMLIGLAIRVDEEYLGDPMEPHPEEFFWEMIKNLGLDDYTDKRFNAGQVKKRVAMWIDRRFTKNGLGSPFPVYNDDRDQRDLEIWDQMNSYINEKYG